MEVTNWSSDRGDLVMKILREDAKARETKGDYVIHVWKLQEEVDRENLEDEMLAKKSKEKENEQENLF
jgi:hypothetical protein